MGLKDKIALHELMSRYVSALDEHFMEGLAECFVDSARFSISVEGLDADRSCGGRDEIMSLFRDAAAAQPHRRRHVITNIFVDPRSEGEANVSSNLTLFEIKDGS